MTDQNSIVTPGVPVTLSVALPGGATIYNRDTQYPVYVSSTPDVSTNSIRIGPLGSLQWTSNLTPVYAIADPTATNNVPVTISSDIQGMNNPVDVAVSVASQLNAKGIPNVLVGNIVVSGPLPNPGGAGVPFKVGQFASLAMSFNALESGILTLQWVDDVTGKYVTSESYPMAAGTASRLDLVATVKASRLVIYWSIPNGTLTVNMYGSNRVIPERVCNQTQTLTMNLNQAFGVQGRAFFPPNPNSADYSYISNGKPSYLRIVVTGGGKGMFGFVSMNSQGSAEQYNDIVDTSTGVTGLDGVITQRDILLPPGCLKIYFTSYVAATYTVGLTLTQQL